MSKSASAVGSLKASTTATVCSEEAALSPGSAYAAPIGSACVDCQQRRTRSTAHDGSPAPHRHSLRIARRRVTQAGDSVVVRRGATQSRARRLLDDRSLALVVGLCAAGPI